MNRILIASDHAGYQTKEAIKKKFSNYEWSDLGCNSVDSVDYPDYAKKLCVHLLEDKEQKFLFGILICGTGIGMSITANRFAGIRAALCCDRFTSKMSRAHNDANVLVLGANVLKEEEIYHIISIFAETSFDGGRHERRIQKMDME